MYYLEQRPISDMVRLQRRVLLPEYAIGKVVVDLGALVDVRDAVARGSIPARHVILDASRQLGVNADRIDELLLVDKYRLIEEETAIAGNNANRGRRVFAPFDGMVVGVDNGRIIFKAPPQTIELEAGVRGRVVQVIEGRGVSVETTGGVVQGIWGNDKTAIASTKFEPDTGLENMPADDIGSMYRGTITITKTPLTEREIHIATAQKMAGIIAPSMDARLEPIAFNATMPIMIVTGFGDSPFTRSTLQILQKYEGYQSVLDAAYPSRFDDRRSELMIDQYTKERIPAAEAIPLRTGIMVRITRAPWAGRIGELVSIPDEPILLENGLRVHGVLVEIGVDKIPVPLANIEVAGT